MSASNSKIVQDVYDPMQVGSIDGTDRIPHDRAITRAINSTYKVHNDKVKGLPKCTILIAGLSPQTKESTLTRKFQGFGKILKCTLIRDVVTGVSKCYGFIEFKHRASTRDAVDNMNATFIDDHKIIVDYELERTLKNWKPRRLGGGFGGKKESGQLRFGCRNRPYQYNK